MREEMDITPEQIEATGIGYVARPSIQEFSVPPDLRRPADRYFEWVDRHVPMVSVTTDGDHVAMHVLGSRRPAIALRAKPSVDGREVYEVEGGFFVARRASGTFTFEFVQPSRLRITLQGFAPRLPKLLYLFTHSVVHEYVMWSFRRHMEVPLLEEV